MLDLTAEQRKLARVRLPAVADDSAWRYACARCSRLVERGYCCHGSGARDTIRHAPAGRSSTQCLAANQIASVAKAEHSDHRVFFWPSDLQR
jgi:hypothetical protein